jgi:hypothetical protein
MTNLTENVVNESKAFVATKASKENANERLQNAAIMEQVKPHRAESEEAKALKIFIQETVKGLKRSLPESLANALTSATEKLNSEDGKNYLNTYYSFAEGNHLFSSLIVNLGVQEFKTINSQCNAYLAEKARTAKIEKQKREITECATKAAQEIGINLSGLTPDQLLRLKDLLNNK